MSRILPPVDAVEEDPDDEEVGGDDDSEVELEHADATREDPFDEFPLELATLLLALVLLLSTTSVSAASIRCRLMTGCSLADDDDDDDEEDDAVGIPPMGMLSLDRSEPSLGPRPPLLPFLGSFPF